MVYDDSIYIPSAIGWRQQALPIRNTTVSCDKLSKDLRFQLPATKPGRNTRLYWVWCRLLDFHGNFCPESTAYALSTIVADGSKNGKVDIYFVNYMGFQQKIYPVNGRGLEMSSGYV